MTKEAQSPNDERGIAIVRHLIICHSFELRHSDFGILSLNQMRTGSDYVNIDPAGNYPKSE
jgi:hypothetical protein